jgi:hypothetical protein
MRCSIDNEHGGMACSPGCVSPFALPWKVVRELDGLTYNDLDRRWIDDLLERLDHG